MNVIIVVIVAFILALPAAIFIARRTRKKEVDHTRSAELERSPTGGGVDVMELLGRGQKIQAIKRYREIHGVGLKKAKEAIDRLERDRG